jgi:hypothetical protein
MTKMSSPFNLNINPLTKDYQTHAERNPLPNHDIKRRVVQKSTGSKEVVEVLEHKSL